MGYGANFTCSKANISGGSSIVRKHVSLKLLLLSEALGCSNAMLALQADSFILRSCMGQQLHMGEQASECCHAHASYGSTLDLNTGYSECVAPHAGHHQEIPGNLKHTGHLQPTVSGAAAW